MRPRQPGGRHLGLYHFGLKVGDTDDELREAVARLEEAGVPIVGSSDHTVTHSLYILDPDGNEIELYIDVPGVDWKSDPSLIMAPVRPLAASGAEPAPTAGHRAWFRRLPPRPGGTAHSS